MNLGFRCVDLWLSVFRVNQLVLISLFYLAGIDPAFAATPTASTPPQATSAKAPAASAAPSAAPQATSAKAPVAGAALSAAPPTTSAKAPVAGAAPSAAPPATSTKASVAAAAPSVTKPSLGLIFASPQALLGVPLASTPYSGAALPTSVDLSPDLPPPGNQGTQESCVAWAVSYALKTFEEHVQDKLPLVSGAGSIDTSRVFSPAYIYNQINNGRDGGALFEDALNILSQQGDASLALMPYIEKDFTTQPTAAARSFATTYRIDYWRQVNVQDNKEIKAHLAAGYPVLIGAMIDEGFYHLQAGQIWHSVVGNQLGGHALLLVGYDDQLNAFKLVNSWGTSWGDHGFGWIDYGFLPSVVREGYVVKDSIHGAAPHPAPPPATIQALALTSPVSPKPPAASQFAATNIVHNVSSAYGPGMNIEGNLAIPRGTQGTVQVVIYIFYNSGTNQTGIPVGSVMLQFASPQGQAATGTPKMQIPSAGLAVSWHAFLPYYVMNVPKGLQMTPYGLVGMPRASSLVAQPVLYIDDFGVAKAQPIPFIVNL